MTGGENHLIMLDADGSIWTTGLNSNGQLGKNNTVNSAVHNKCQMQMETLYME